MSSGVARTLPRRRRAPPGRSLFLESTPRGRARRVGAAARCPGQAPRRGQVIDAGETTHGRAGARGHHRAWRPTGSQVTLTGEVARATVGRELLGRAFNGVGAPARRPAAPVGEAMRSARRARRSTRRARLPPADFIETGISAIDGMNTLVRGQKLPVFSGPGLPGARARRAHRGVGARAPRRAVRRRLRRHRHHRPRDGADFLDRVRAERRAGAQRALSSTRRRTRPSSACSRRASRWPRPSTSRSRPGCTCSS